MPAPSSFIDLTSETFPFSRTIAAADFNAGTYGDAANEAYFKYTPATDLAIAAFIDDQTGFAPRSRIYESDALTLKKTVSDNASWFWVLTAGTTYYVRITDTAGDGTTGDVVTSWDTRPVLSAIPEGSIVVNDDEEGFPAMVLDENGTVLGILPDVPSGEIGDALPSGISLWHDRFGLHGSTLALVDADGQLIAALDTSPSLGGAFPLITNDGTDFYVVSTSSGAVSKFTTAGVATDGIAQLPAGTYKAAGVSRDGTILYWAEGYDSAAIHRHSLTSDTALSDLYTVPGLTNGYVALTSVNEHPGEILVLSDGTIVTWYRDWDASPATDTLIHLSAAGAVLHSYTYESGTAKIDHIAKAADDPDAIRVWFFLGGDFDEQTGRFARVLLSDGTADPSFEADLFSAGVNKIAGSDQLFGPSASCTFLTIVYDSGETPPPEPEVGTIVVTKVTDPDGSAQSFPFTAGGGLSPTSFDLTDGQSRTFSDVPVGSGYSIAETVPSGWSVTYDVSAGGGSPSNLTVAANETTTVTVTNSQIATEGGDHGLGGERRPIRRLRRGPHLTAEGLWQVFQAFQIEMETGVGLPDGQGSDPMLMLRWSDDGGHTWSNEYWVSAGRQGKYGWRAIWRRLGRSRDRIFEVSMSDPVKWHLIEGHITVIQGTN